jgi:hypothetical protein
MAATSNMKSVKVAPLTHAVTMGSNQCSNAGVNHRIFIPTLPAFMRVLNAQFFRRRHG